MRVLFHPDFPKDQRKFEAEYAKVSIGLAQRFREDVGAALEAIKAAPSAAGHFVHTGAAAVTEYRRRNLTAFPFFVLYGWTADVLVFGAIIPTRSDPLNWLVRFSGP